MAAVKRNVILFALHGFMGLEKDWEFLEELSDILKLVPLSIFDGSLAAALSFSSLQECADQVQAYCQAHTPFETLPILLGYSLGGRIALHCLKKHSNFWKGGIIVSSHPGLITKEERKKRKELDQKWAKEVLELSWEAFTSKWESQPVFLGSKPLSKGKKIDKKRLALALEVLSLSRQKNFKSFLDNTQIPLLWVAGARDEKFSEISQKVKKERNSVEVWIAKECGHRVPWDDKDLFQKKLREFIRKVKEYEHTNKDSRKLG
jgi:2-succinyl-6-hydroxy-2,4-cyclohexadiene-1-carboxylate synthase